MADLKAKIVSQGLMRVAEVQEFLGLSRASVYQLMDRGQLPWAKLGRARRIPRQAVVDLAARSLNGSALEVPARRGRDAPGRRGT